MADKSLDWQMENDPKHLAFTLARYGFVAKMFDGYGKVLEVGCGNRFGGQVVARAVHDFAAVDIPGFDITRDYSPGNDGVFMLDVFEHIPKAQESAMLDNLAKCAPVCIIGTPSLESQAYASPESRRLHVNCVTGARLSELCKMRWKHVFMLSMNDSTLHTGHFAMSHYLIAMCCEPIIANLTTR